MSVLIVDCRYYEEACTAWGKEYRILPSFRHPHLAKPVCAHPDMTLFPFADGVCFCPPSALPYYREIFADLPIKIVAGSAELDRHYPQDIAYNIARVGNALIGHSLADPRILRHAKENRLSFTPTKQGYAKCSSCIISENALITSDPSIADSAQSADLDVLRIQSGGVSLPGYSCGFFGGACGLTSQGELLVFGDLACHPDQEKILAFCAKYGVRVRDIKNRRLTDIGTILSIDA